MKILLVVYDNDSYISTFPLGVAYVASACRNAGHEVRVYNQDVYHWPESHLIGLLNREHFDVIGVGVIGGYYQYRKLLKISDAINKSKKRPFYIIAGHGPSPEPEYFLKKTKADVVVRGEGEVTIVELLKALEEKKELSCVDGIAFIINGKYFQTPKRSPITNINEISLPAWDLFPMDHYTLLRPSNVKNNKRCMGMITGRGCTFKCNFCYRMDPGFRPRAIEGIVEEIKILKKNYNVSDIVFLDELTMSSEERIILLCKSFIKQKLNINWWCSGRLNYAKKDVLKLMKESGCVFINYGIESLDEKALRTMGKALTVKQIIAGIENTLAVGINPGFNIIFGNIGETKESLKLGVDFLIKYDDHSQMRTIRPVTPYPGSPLYDYAIEKGFLKDCADFYENKHINSDLLTVNFTNMNNEEYYKNLFEANKLLLTNYFNKKREATIKESRKLYFELDADFRGFRQT